MDQDRVQPSEANHRDAPTPRKRGQHGKRRTSDNAWMTAKDAIRAGMYKTSLDECRRRQLVAVRQLPGGAPMYSRADIERVLRESITPAVDQSKAG